MNNNWDQYQSTPKLLPPTVFEKTSERNPNVTGANNTLNSTLTSSPSINLHNNNANNSNVNSTVNCEGFYGENQFLQLSNELEKLKIEIKKLHSENEILRHKNKGFTLNFRFFSNFFFSNFFI